jgi:putative flippase GtrA
MKRFAEMVRRVTGPAFLRFAISGAINTGISYGIYLLLLLFLPYLVAYTIAYLAGIATSYFLMTGFVFATPASWSTAWRFPLIYVVQYLLGTTVIYVAVEFLHVRPWIAAFIALLVVIGPTFMLARLIFGRNRGKG